MESESVSEKCQGQIVLSIISFVQRNVRLKSRIENYETKLKTQIYNPFNISSSSSITYLTVV